MESASEDQRSRNARKSATAYRTISEVAEELNVPQHVLRFWETKFSQVRPLKRGGGRRYYRPEDLDLLRRIQRLLYQEGYTIKGVQRLLRESRVAMPATAPEEPEGEEPGDLPPETPPSGEADLFQAAEPVPAEDSVPQFGLSPAVRAELSALLDELRDLRAALRIEEV